MKATGMNACARDRERFARYFADENEAVGAVIMASDLRGGSSSTKLLAGLRRRADAVPRTGSNGRHRAASGRNAFGEVHRLCTALGVPALLHAPAPPQRHRAARAVRPAARAARSFAAVCFVPGDQPLLRRSTVDRMCAAFASSQEKKNRTFSGCAHRRMALRSVGIRCSGRGYFDALLHLPEGKGGGAVLRQHTECVRLFAAGHPADGGRRHAGGKLTQEAALEKVLPKQEIDLPGPFRGLPPQAIFFTLC